MSKYQLYIIAEASSTAEKTTILKLKYIRSIDDETWHSFPDDSQPLNLHKGLLEISSIKNIGNAIKTRGQYRKVNVVLTPEIEKNYKDEAGNFLYNNFLLSEYNPPPMKQIESKENFSELTACLTKIVEKKDDPLKEIMKHFLIEKFTTKNKNVIAWLDSFEQEANRFKLTGSKLIEVFRLCLDQSMNDWFSSAQKRIGITAEWNSWKEDLISTFHDLSWSPIRFAFNFRHMNGSYVDFVVKKERLLLDLDHDIPHLIMLNLIVLGLPVSIQNTLNRETVTNLKDLIKKLKKFDRNTSSDEVHMKNLSNKLPKLPDKTVKPSKTTSTEKKPCSFCEKNNKGIRFHPEHVCWFRDKPSDKIRIVNNVQLEDELNSVVTDPKNL